MLPVLDYSELRLCHMDFVLQFLYSLRVKKVPPGGAALMESLCAGVSQLRSVQKIVTAPEMRVIFDRAAAW